MSRRRLLLLAPSLAVALIIGCTKQERCVEEDDYDIKVDAPYAKVRVRVPKDNDEKPRVKVEVDD